MTLSISKAINGRYLQPDEFRDFRRRRFAADRRALVHIAYFGIAAGLGFLCLDLIRYDDLQMAWWRLIFIGSSVIMAFLAARCYSRTQLTGVGLSYVLVLVITATAKDYLVDNISPLFFSNFMLVPIFFLMFYPGFRMATALVSTVVLMLFFTTYSLWNYPENPIHRLQLANTLFLTAGMAIAGKVLRNRYVADYFKQMKYRAQSLKLDEANQVKNQLLSVLSHDVKSPLISLKQVLSVLKDGDLDRETELRLHGMLEEKVNVTTDFVTNTIHWVKNQMDGMEVNPEPLDLRDLVFDCLELYRDPIENKRLYINADNLGLHTVKADREMTKIALRNLLNNAIKFSPSGEEITLEARESPTGIRFRIIDRGPGIPTKHIDKIFKFQAGDNHHAGGEYATGIGLVLTGDFVKRNGGQIRVDSDPEGGNTLFEILFPAARRA